MTTLEAPFLEAGALVVASALQGDQEAVRLILQSLPVEQTPAVCEGAVIAMAHLLAEFLPPDAIRAAIAQARAVATEASTEGETP